MAEASSSSSSSAAADGWSTISELHDVVEQDIAKILDKMSPDDLQLLAHRLGQTVVPAASLKTRCKAALEALGTMADVKKCAEGLDSKFANIADILFGGVARCGDRFHAEYSKHKYSELHTHFSGMGDAEFWISVLQQEMYSSLAERGDDAWQPQYWGPFRADHRPFYNRYGEPLLPESYYSTNPTRIYNLPGIVIKPQLFAQLFEQWSIVDDKASLPFSSDLVLAKAQFGDNWAKLPQRYAAEWSRCKSRQVPWVAPNSSSELQVCFDICISLSDLLKSAALTGPYTEERVADVFEVDTRGRWRPYLYFSAAEQQFKVVHQGMRASELVQIFEEKKKLDKLTQCFCFRKDSSSPPDVSWVQDQFSSKFLPRFHLRKIIMSQRLRVYRRLMEHVLLRYVSSCVEYVEFSVGVGDLLRPWVYKQMLEVQSPVRFKFLAAFQRSDVRVRYGSNKKRPLETLDTWDQKVDFLESRHGQESFATLVNNGNISFEKACDQLALLDQEMLAWAKVDFALCRGLDDAIVGLDIVGDEHFMPYVPFVTQPFLQFVRAWTRRKRIRFGCRVHYGEISIVPPGHVHRSAFDVHMKWGTEIIQRLLDENVPVRIGHGVAFAENVEREGYLPGLKIQQDSKFLIEINPTSNAQLLSNPAGLLEGKSRHAISSLKKQFACSISTDDDGIIGPIQAACGCSKRSAVSVEAESFSLFLDGSIDNCDLINFSIDGHKHRFGSPVFLFLFSVLYLILTDAFSVGCSGFSLIANPIEAKVALVFTPETEEFAEFRRDVAAHDGYVLSHVISRAPIADTMPPNGERPDLVFVLVKDENLGSCWEVAYDSGIKTHLTEGPTLTFAVRGIVAWANSIPCTVVVVHVQTGAKCIAALQTILRRHYYISSDGGASQENQGLSPDPSESEKSEASSSSDDEKPSASNKTEDSDNNEDNNDDDDENDENDTEESSE